MSVFVTHYPRISSEITGGCSGHRLASLILSWSQNAPAPLNGREENGLHGPAGYFLPARWHSGRKAEEFFGCSSRPLESIKLFSPPHPLSPSFVHPSKSDSLALDVLKYWYINHLCLHTVYVGCWSWSVVILAVSLAYLKVQSNWK